MRKVIASEFMTLDGVIEDPGGGEGVFEHGGWSFKFPDSDGAKEQYKFEELMDCDTQLLGRVTYEGFAEAWPSLSDEAGFADKMNGMPKYVVTSTLKDEDLEWNNSRVIEGDVANAVRELKEQSGGDILIGGSATLVQGLMKDGLIDEFRLIVHPIVLGSGKRLFAEGVDTTVLELADTKPLGSVVLLTYKAATR